MGLTLKTPKSQLLVIFGILLVAAGGVPLWPKLLAAVLPACAVDVLWTRIDKRRWKLPSSALLTALIVFFILSSNESWLVIGGTSAFAIISKYILRTNREHIFNPAAAALVWAPVAFGSGESWWGALGDQPLTWMALLIATGAFMTDRLNKFPMVLTFLGAYFSLFSLASLGNAHSVAEMFRGPFVQAALFLAFFMLTDPPTSANRYIDQLWFGLVAAAAAVAAQLLGAGQVFLLVGLLAANGVLALVRVWRRRSIPSPARARGYFV